MANEAKVNTKFPDTMVEPTVVAKPANDGLVKMKKHDEFTRVDPTTVKSHVAAGWKVCE